MQRNHLSVVPDEHDIDKINCDLIAEFATYMEVADSTRVKYRARLEEFRVWLGHARGGGNGVPATRLLTSAEPSDVQRFMAYLRSAGRSGSARFWCVGCQ